jgi:hypothetical protein
MRWLLRKIDSLAGAFCAAIGGAALAQMPVFVQQYLQRLGGHVDEARHNLAGLASDPQLNQLEPGARGAFEAVARARVDALQAQLDGLLAATPAMRPLEFLQSFDRAIALATLDRFEPALPLDPAGLLYGAAGVFVGWLLFELLKVPVALLRRLSMSRPARRTRSRGSAS